MNSWEEFKFDAGVIWEEFFVERNLFGKVICFPIICVLILGASMYLALELIIELTRK